MPYGRGWFGRWVGWGRGNPYPFCRHFGVTALVCINKYDVNGDNTRQIESYCLSQRIEVAAKIPFDNVVTEAIVQGLPVVEYSQNKVAHEIEDAVAGCKQVAWCIKGRLS